MTTDHTLRNTDLATLHAALTHEAMHRLDVIVPATQIGFSVAGEIEFDHHTEELIDENGVTPASSHHEQLVPTRVAQEQLSEKLGIPFKYYERCATNEPELLQHNVQTWLARESDSFLIRGLAYPNGGVARAVLSDKFHPIDDIDVLTATLQGVAEAGLDLGGLEISADRSLQRMHVRIDAPSVTVDALDLVDRYEDPRNGRRGRDYPLVSAGLIIRNSDVGHGAFHVIPRITFLICKNGMTRMSESIRRVHLGAQREEGIIEWSSRTQRKELDLITSKSTDAVRQFLTTDYLQSVVDELRGVSRRPIGDPIETVTAVTRKLGFSKDESQLILSAFIGSGDPTPLGLAQAFTLVAQSDELSIERSADFEDSAWRAMTLAAA